MMAITPSSCDCLPDCPKRAAILPAEARRCRALMHVGHSARTAGRAPGVGKIYFFTGSKAGLAGHAPDRAAAAAAAAAMPLAPKRRMVNAQIAVACCCRAASVPAASLICLNVHWGRLLTPKLRQSCAPKLRAEAPSKLRPRTWQLVAPEVWAQPPQQLLRDCTLQLYR
eukprot:190945-Chlamydomonas_euryale.AAC.11